MVSPSNRIDINLQMEQMNHAFRGAIRSKKSGEGVRSYIVIQGGLVGLTTSKRLASSKKELYAYVNQLAQRVVKDSSASLYSRKQLSQLLSKYVKISSPKGKCGQVIQTLRDKIWPSNKRNIQSALHALRIRMNAFELIEQKKPTITQVAQAFKKQLQKKVKVSTAKERTAIMFLHKQAANVLDTLYSEVHKKKLTPEEAVEQVLSRFRAAVAKNNRVTLEFDREDFRQLMGKAVKEGNWKTPDFVTKDDTIKRLIKEYNDGTWVDGKDESGEVIPRTYTYDQLAVSLKDKFLKRSEEVLSSSQCKSVLKRFFEAWQ